MSFCRVVLACFALSFAGACAPSSYPRVAEVAGLHKLRLYAVSNIAYSPGKARAQTPAQLAANAPGKRVEGNVAPVNYSEGAWTGLLFPAWLEYQAAYGIFRPCELGASLSVVRLGAELRCLLVTPDANPVGVALGTAVMHHSLFGTDTGLAAFQWRSTLELSGSALRDTPILNFAISYGRTQRHLYESDALTKTDSDRSWYQSYGIFSVRDEWKLAVPIGYLFNWSSTKDGLIVGVVPEWTFHASEPTPPKCVGCLEHISAFQQRFALFVTIGLNGIQE